MKAIEWASMIAGCLCLLAALLLASPGVRVVSAAGDGATAAGPTCEANALARESASLETFLARLRLQQLRARDAEQLPFSLNNRGYAYGRPPGIDLGRVEREARGQVR